MELYQKVLLGLTVFSLLTSVIGIIVGVPESGLAIMAGLGFLYMFEQE